MKRVGQFFCLAAALIVLMAGCGQGKKLKAGTYEGIGQGNAKGTPIRLSVTIDESGKIYEMKILEHQETPQIGGKALDKLVEQATTKNTAEVDTISGATRTSEGFRDALRAALAKAAGEESSATNEKATSSASAEAASKVQ
ncbi:FMN-binding protein [Levyella massiliensis]|uniref:FMN-binding protein n=1 Tax=Levyella massiliensis TaxID=938289 RepID=UPI003EBB98DC